MFPYYAYYNNAEDSNVYDDLSKHLKYIYIHFNFYNIKPKYNDHMLPLLPNVANMRHHLDLWPCVCV